MKIEVKGNTLEIVYRHNANIEISQRALARGFKCFGISLLDMVWNTSYMDECQKDLSDYINTHTEEAYERAVFRTSLNTFILDIWGGENIFGSTPKDSPALRFLIEHNMKLFMPLIKMFENGRIPNYKSIKMEKIYPKEYDKSQFTKNWDAKRVISALVELMSANQITENIDENPSVLAKRMRLISAVSAFLNIPFAAILCNFGYFSEGCFIRNISPELAAEIRSLMEIPGNDLRNQYLKEQIIDKRFCIGAFKTMLKYRIQIAQAMTVFSGVLEANGGYTVGLEKVVSVYNPELEKLNNQVDSILGKLLGDDFQKSFTELELIQKYKYPTVTDHQILEWEIENKS